MPGRAPLRDHRRGGQHPDRRGADAADHLGAGLRRRPQVRRGRPDRPAAETRCAFRGQGEGAHLPPERRRNPRGRAHRRRRELLHARQHGMAPPDRQCAQGPSPLPPRPRLRGSAQRRGGDRRRVHRPADDRPPVVRRAAPGRRGQGARQDQGREPDAGHDHLAELLQAVQEAGGHDRHGHDRGERVLQGLRPGRDRDPDQPAVDPAQLRRRDLPVRAREVGAILDEIKEVHETGRPILVGTTSIEKSEELAEC